MRKQNSQECHKNAKLNNSKSEAAPQTSTFFDVFDEVLSSRDVVNIPEKKEVGFERQTSEQEMISLDGGSSSLTNSTDSGRSSGGKMYSLYKNQEILRRDQVKPSLRKKRLLKFSSIYDPKALSKCKKFFLNDIVFYWKKFLNFWVLASMFLIKWFLTKNRPNILLEINPSFDRIF